MLYAMTINLLDMTTNIGAGTFIGVLVFILMVVYALAVATDKNRK